MVGRTLNEISQFIDLSFITKKNKDYRILDETGLIEYVQMMKLFPRVAVDTETDGLNFKGVRGNNNTLVGICLSVQKNTGVYIPIDHCHPDIKNVSYKILKKYLFPALETMPCVTHNGIFDFKVFYSMGIRINIRYDSMLLLFNMFSKVARGSKALKTATRQLYGDETVEFEDIFPDRDYTMYRHIDPEVCRIYGCCDADYTLSIVDDFECELSKATYQAYLSDCSMICMIAESEYWGKPIDVETFQIQLEQTKENIRVLENTLYEFVGWKLTGQEKSKYIFQPSSNDELVVILYDMLGYKVVDSKGKTGLKVDVHVLEKLQKSGSDLDLSDRVQTYVKKNILNKIPNLREVDAKGNYTPLVSNKDLTACRCVAASLILALRAEQKYLSSFFNKIERERQGECNYYSGISMTNTETGRLVDFLQTLAGNLKSVISVKQLLNKYMIVLDFSQIEYRVMVGLACLHMMKTKLDNPHTDFHIECVSWILNMPPHKVTKKMRKRFKSINFAIPYGMAVSGLIDSMYGIGLADEERKSAEKEVKDMFDRWYAALPEVMEMLNDYRTVATTPRPYTKPNVKTKGRTSYVTAPDGGVRVFDLGDESKQTLSKIERMSGNFPIQRFARSIYLTAVMRLYKTLIKEGLTNVLTPCDDSPTGQIFTCPVTINAYVHDEIVMLIDKNINHEYVCKLIADNCMVNIKDHPQYFCGINVCTNWSEGKEGVYEAPIDWIRTLKDPPKFTEETEPQAKFEKTVFNFCNMETIKYAEGILGKELTENRIVDMDKLMSGWTDYYYTTKVRDYGYSYEKIDKSLIKSLEEQERDEEAVRYEIKHKLVGTLLFYKYKSITIIDGINTTTVTQYLDTVERPSNKEKELQEILYEKCYITEELVELPNEEEPELELETTSEFAYNNFMLFKEL